MRFFNVILAVKAIDLECNEIQKRRGLMEKPLVFHPRLKIGYMLWGVTEDGMYALKKVLIQSEEQLELVRLEIQVSPLFKHPNIIRLLESSIINVKVRQRYPTSFFPWRELRSKSCSSLRYSVLRQKFMKLRC